MSIIIAIGIVCLGIASAILLYTGVYNVVIWYKWRKTDDN